MTPPSSALFTPFANAIDAVNVGELSIENGEQRITIFGQLEINRDQQGLAQAQWLAEFFQNLAVTLAAEKTLPAQLPAEIPTASTQIDNPFA